MDQPIFKDKNKKSKLKRILSSQFLSLGVAILLVFFAFEMCVYPFNFAIKDDYWPIFVQSVIYLFTYLGFVFLSAKHLNKNLKLIYYFHLSFLLLILTHYEFGEWNISVVLVDLIKHIDKQLAASIYNSIDYKTFRLLSKIAVTNFVIIDTLLIIKMIIRIFEAKKSPDNNN